MKLKTPAFWYRRASAPAPLAELALQPLSWMYAAGCAVNQNFAQAVKAAMPVVCVGNLVAGGSGKTPAAIALMELLREKKLAQNPHFLTRGYGGSARGPILVDYFRHGAPYAGDESLLLAKCAYTILSADRAAGADFAKERHADFLIMDDGFQNGTLYKDISFIVIDGSVGFGNGKLIPAGPLREPLQGGIARANAFILIGKDKAGINEILPAGKPVFTARVEVAPNFQLDTSKRYVAFAGLGRPEKFYRLLQNLGADIAGWHPFPDHFAYMAEDIQKLEEEAKAKNAILITTEKDHKRLPGKSDIAFLPVQLVWDDAETLASFLLEKLNEQNQ